MRRSRKIAASALAGTLLATVLASGASATTETENLDTTDTVTPETDTVATFDLVAGDNVLAITVPTDGGDGSTAVDLNDADRYSTTAGKGTSGAATFVTDKFGPVKVTDSRALPNLSVGTASLWTATATGSDFCIDSNTSTPEVVECSTEPSLVVSKTTAIYDPSGGSLVAADGSLLEMDGTELGLTDGSLLDADSVTLAAGVLDDALANATVVYLGSGNSEFSWTPRITFALSPSQAAGRYSGTIYHDLS